MHGKDLIMRLITSTVAIGLSVFASLNSFSYLYYSRAWAVLKKTGTTDNTSLPKNCLRRNCKLLSKQYNFSNVDVVAVSSGGRCRINCKLVSK